MSFTAWYNERINSYKNNQLFHLRDTGKGIYYDIKDRLIKYYVSDIKDGLTYRTIPSTVYIFFTNLLPALAFAQDMFDHTNNSYGVNEVLLASAMGGIVFGLFAGSPLCIVGVTGPISIFNYTVYEIVVPKNIPYFPFMCWICLWSMLFHFILAFTNSVNFMRYVTKFSCDVFGFFINIVYIQKGIQILTHQFSLTDTAGAFASIMLALIMAIFGISAQIFGTKSHYLSHNIRSFIRDYSTPLCVIFFTGFIHFGGRLDDVKFPKLPITRSFHPTDTINRGPNWLIHFWEDITVGQVFLAIPFAILLTILFYYDHNISSLMCQSSEFPLKKPASFHYDFFLLGVTTGIAGLIGIPAPNGLIPQAPLHTYSLCIYEYDYKTGINKITKVVEQRLSNTFQGLITLVMMTRPFLVVLGLIPQGVLAGLFWIMAITTIDGTDVVRRLRFIFTDDLWKTKLSKIVIDDDNKAKLKNNVNGVDDNCNSLESNFGRDDNENDTVKKVNSTCHEFNNNDRNGQSQSDDEIEHIIPADFPVEYFKTDPKYFKIYVVLELLAFAGEYSITCTKGAIGFPGVLMLILILVPILFPKIFPKEQLELLDGDAADELIMNSLKLKDSKNKTDLENSTNELVEMEHISRLAGN
ncbi:Bor1 protein [Pichia kluyveri]|uniref:Bor1 protein n=1 Tax=Pichia kluyveri TaxID=36015 RepID=A0AAV5RBP4_PICKL|nr:Bor1 protein [Pichia kluyveri]